MKSVILSVRPEWVAKILNGEKTIEIRKKFPKDYVGWVYIYCTKGRKLIWLKENSRCEEYINGKVVARFWCDKVEDLHIKYGLGWETETIKGTQEIEKAACVDRYNLYDYCKGKAYAIHITKLEVFDRPRELCEFHTNIKKEPPEELLCPECGKPMEYYEYKYLTKAPQSYCFIEIGE